MDTTRQSVYPDYETYQYMSPRRKSILRLTVSVAGYKFPYPHTSEIPPQNGHLMRPEQANSPVYKALFGRFQDDVDSIRSPVRFRSSILDEIKMSHSSARHLPFSSVQMDKSLPSSDAIYTSDDNSTSVNNSAQTETTIDDETIEVDEWEERTLIDDLDNVNYEVEKTVKERFMGWFQKDRTFPYFGYKQLKEERCPEYEFSQLERRLRDAKKNKKRSVLSVVRQMGKRIQKAVSRK